jgi:hypothetical protein
MEFRQAFLRFQTEEGGCPRIEHLLISGIRQESAFTNNMLIAVQKRVDGLKSQVRHACPIGVRIGQANGQPVSPDPLLATTFAR